MPLTSQLCVLKRCALMALLSACVMRGAAQATPEPTRRSLENIVLSSGEKWGVAPFADRDGFNAMYFAREVRLRFLTDSIVQLELFQYSPSIGGRTAKSAARYTFDATKQEACLQFLNEDEAKAPRISEGGKPLQWSAYALSGMLRTGENRAPTHGQAPAELPRPRTPDASSLPRIEQYCFVVNAQSNVSEMPATWLTTWRFVVSSQQEILFGEVPMVAQALSPEGTQATLP
jgi:hypothetical protein